MEVEREEKSSDAPDKIRIVHVFVLHDRIRNTWTKTFIKPTRNLLRCSRLCVSLSANVSVS